jgi:hypothetical protein
MNLESMEGKALTGSVTMPTDFWNAQAWKGATFNNAFEFVLGDQGDQKVWCSCSISRANGDYEAFPRKRSVGVTAGG